MDPTGLDNKAEDIPNQSSTKQKHNASPLQEQTRSVRQRHEPDNEVSNQATTSGDATNEPNTNKADDNTGNANNNIPGSAINNIYFPTFKLLRKINNKLVTAKHHRVFLNNLRENGQVPKGLQIKSAPTGAELDLTSYEEWEKAHI